LFRRVRRISGLNSYLGQIDKALKGRKDLVKKSQSKIDTPETILTLYVEGKKDEIVLSSLVQEIGLAGKLGVKDVKVVSVGPILAERLIDTINNLSPFSLFVLDQGKTARTARKNILQKECVVEIDPGVISFFRLDEILEDESIRTLLGIPEDKVQVDDLEDPDYQREMEALIFAPPRSALENTLSQIIPRFLDTQKVDEFVANLKARIEARKDTADGG